ncbi:hypothetical protein SAMN02745247_01097 [Butyrivibrio hungatei DSM 14810]|uniref:Lipoprotein n=1 Tax=Butyrivibrio hungatei DSM 14810 TaxID=1121132 RepID=A0A1M7S659_9FIRM|nr:hypothetical protein [Butyrivibrio hungatei]SHN53835.1 hypothetical protein SAMN02745247_01097 [Butyrivibrio hungatei DSM 14810]
MKKYSVILAATVMAASLMACGTGASGTGESASELSAEALSTEETAPEQAEDTTLGVPVVKDGVMQAGEDCVETYFEWNAIDGADGYEVSVLNKYYGEAEFTEPAEVYETTDCNYTLGAQDYWDFLIKVRAYKGTGADRVYGEWSEEAAGFTYDDSEIADDTVTEANDVSGGGEEDPTV